MPLNRARWRRRSSSDTDPFVGLERLVLDGAGHVDPAVRKAAFHGETIDDSAAQGYVEKVRVRAYTMTDSDVEGLRSAGWTEDAIFELTVAAALGAGWSRLELARRAIHRARDG